MWAFPHRGASRHVPPCSRSIRGIEPSLFHELLAKDVSSRAVGAPVHAILWPDDMAVCGQGQAPRLASGRLGPRSEVERLVRQEPGQFRGALTVVRTHQKGTLGEVCARSSARGAAITVWDYREVTSGCTEYDPVGRLTSHGCPTPRQSTAPTVLLATRPQLGHELRALSVVGQSSEGRSADLPVRVVPVQSQVQGLRVAEGGQHLELLQEDYRPVRLSSPLYDRHRAVCAAVVGGLCTARRTTVRAELCGARTRVRRATGGPVICSRGIKRLTPFPKSLKPGAGLVVRTREPKGLVRGFGPRYLLRRRTARSRGSSLAAQAVGRPPARREGRLIAGEWGIP
jgi:hypothetical protein